MGKLVVIKIGEGNLEKLGLPVTLCIGEEGLPFHTSLDGQLPPSQISLLYENWQSDYRQKVSGRMIPKTAQVSNRSDTDLIANSKLLKNELNNWLNSETFRPLKEKFLEKVNTRETVRVIVQSENPLLRRLPWYLWDLFESYRFAEVALSSPTFDRAHKSVQPKAKVRILAILGDSSAPDPRTGIRLDINADKQFLESLPDAETVFLVEPKRHEFNEQLWDVRGWDILFFAGHSSSQSDGTTGQMYINSQESLTVEDLKLALKKAIERGLQLAIFNSCDGLGIARDLAELQIPQIIAMREPVPDFVAKEFVKYFLTSFSSGKILDLAVREARERLHGVEKESPCASWLPVICQNPAENSVTWQELRGITPGINWRDACLKNIPERGKLTSNSMLANDGLNLNVDDVYVPLGLVERKQKPKPDREIKPEQGSQLYGAENQYEITKIFKNDEFFEQVLKQGKTDKSQGKRIGIIGEPGSGKTTLLKKIADWVLAETEAVPIWISLADLGKFSLEDYLLQKWLKIALNVADVTAQMRQDLVALFKNHQLWLLLDGADEMSAGNPLDEIKSQLRGWIAEARVVLTCRYNVWDAGKNVLSEFDVYRNLDFDEEEQIPQFIRSVFQQSDLGERLCQKLAESENARLRDTVKNPLRLTLLCLAWHIRQGDFTTKTQADLYAQFTEAVYEWKREQFPTTSQQRRELNKALATLALRGMEEEESRFRLRQGWVREVLGEADESLCELALQLGWINRVGVAAERPEEQVYAFYHPTFQEYFAALGVDNWSYFLNHVPDNPGLGIYRIFELQWKQIILLWFGREDVRDEKKEGFIKALVDFDDGCGEWKFEKIDRGLYKYRAFFLAAAGIGEFKTCSLADTIIQQLVKEIFGYFNTEKQEWLNFIYLIANDAGETLLQTDRKRAIEELCRILKHPHCPERIRINAAGTLGLLAPRHPQAIAELFRIIENTKDLKILKESVVVLEEIGQTNQQVIIELIKIINHTQIKYTFDWAGEVLGKIGKGNLPAIAELSEILQTTKNEAKRRRSFYCLGKIAEGNPQAIEVLVTILKTTDNELIRRYAIQCLGEIGQGNSQAIEVLIKIFETTDDELTRRQTIASLGKIDPKNPKIISFLVSFIKFIENEDNRLEAAQSLERMYPGNPQTISELAQIIETTDKKYNRCRAAVSLMEIGSGKFLQRIGHHIEQILLRRDSGYPQAINTLIRILETNEDEYLLLDVATAVGTIEPSYPPAIAALVKILETNEDEYLLQKVAEALGEIGCGNFQAIEALSKLLENTEDENIYCETIESLGKIGFGNPYAIDALVKVIENTQDEDTFIEAVESIEKIAPYCPQIITVLIKVLKTAKNEEILLKVANSLEKIAPGTPQIITTLVKLLENTEDENICLETANNLEKIAPGTPQIITALVKLLENTENKNILLEAANSLWKVSINQTITTLSHVIERKTEDESIRLAIAEILGEMGQNADEKIFYFIKNFDVTEDEYIRLQNYDWLGQVQQWYIQIIAALFKVLKTIENESSRVKIAEILCEIGLSADLIADLNKIIQNKKVEFIYPQNAEFIEKIKQYHAEVITTLLTLLETTKGGRIGFGTSDIRLEIANLVEKFEPGHPQIIAKLLTLLKTTEHRYTRHNIVSALQVIITTKEQQQGIVTTLKPTLNHETYKNNFDFFESCYMILWDCSQKLTYLQFYTAWHHQLISTHPEAPDNIPVGNPLLTQSIEHQITPNFSQLQPTPQTYSLPINIQSLTDETDINAICQELCTQIYYLALPDTDIPTANNFAELKRHILTAKRKLQKRHLALILHECTPHPTLITCCRKIADANLGLHIAWITDTPLDAPLRGFPPQQPNLLGAIQTWINELS